MNKLLPILALLFFGIILSFEYVSDQYSNGNPKVVKTYAGYSEIDLTKEIGYYSNGIKKYEINYYDGKIKNTQGWSEDGKRADFENIRSSSFKNVEKIGKADLDALKRQIDNINSILVEHRDKYSTVIDSFNLALEGIKFSMERMDERLTDKDKKLEEDILNVTELFDSFKRKTNRDLRQNKNDIKSILTQIEELVFFDKRIPEKYLLDEEEVLELEEENSNP